MSNHKHPVHVAVGVIENSNQEILIAKRFAYQDQGGLWEFPGGKVKSGEKTIFALAREFKEELDIDVFDQRPLIRIHHQYEKYSVLLDVWKITNWFGEPKGKEGQKIVWQSKAKLNEKKYPAANNSIINAIQLPNLYFITPEPSLFEEKIFLDKIEKLLQKDIKIIQFRNKLKPIIQYKSLIKKISNLSKKYNSKLLINAIPDDLKYHSCDGIHLNSRLLTKYRERPVSKDKILSVSCHDREEIIKAQHLEADIILLGPIKATMSHPGAKVLGWKNFKALSEHTNIPIYALGGMKIKDLNDSWSNGAQGLAMISGLW